MKERVADLVGPIAHRMWVSTFHSACARILRRDAPVLGYRSSFSIYDQSDAVRLTDYVRRDLDLDPKRFPARRLHGAISALKNELVTPEEAYDRAFTPPEYRVAEVYREYQQRLLDASAVDFDDLLTLTVRLFREHPDVLARWRARFSQVLVDEFQDTNIAQWELVRMLTEEHRNVLVVGDTDQSIYRFRGADFRNLLRFEEVFPDATVIVLEQNYRSTQRILDAANAVIANNAARRPKQLWTEQIGGELITRYHAEDEHDEARFVVSETMRLVDTDGQRFNDVAVFYRTNAQSRVIEEQLVRGGVPYRVVGGVKFYDRREVKDLLAYLRALVNPDDEVSWRRVVNTPKRGVGETSVNRVAAYAQGAGLTFREALREAAAAGVTGKALGGVGELLELMETFEYAAESGVAATVEAVLEETGYIGRARGRAHHRSAGPDREPPGARRGLPRVRRGTRRGRPHRAPRDRRRRHGRRSHRTGRHPDRARAGPGLPRSHLARHRPRHGRGRGWRAERGHPHDAPLREGPRVPRGVHHRSRRRRVPPHPEPRRSRRARGGAATLLRGNHARARAALPVPRVVTDALRLHRLLPAEPIPRRDPRRAGARAQESVKPIGGRGRSHRDAVVEAAIAAAPAGARGAESLGIRVGDDVAHEKFGEGVVLELIGDGDRTEAVVNFPEVGEKRLLLAWAPLQKI